SGRRVPPDGGAWGASGALGWGRGVVRGIGWPLVLALGCGPSHTYRDGRGLEGQLEREVVALQQRVRALEFELAQSVHGGDPGPIYANLHQLFAGTEISVDRRGGITVVTLPVGHLFADPYNLRFRQECQMSLDLLATALKDYPEQPVVVDGHTDDRMLTSSSARRC